MSGRGAILRTLVSVTSLTAVALAAVVAPAAELDAQQIVVRAGDGGTLTLQGGDTTDVPIHVDMSQAAGQDLASLTFELSWDPSVFRYSTNTPGSFGSVVVNDADTANGRLTVSVFSATGTTTSFVTIDVELVMGAIAPPSKIVPTVTAAGDEQGNDIRALVSVDDLDLTCAGAAGLWGDVTGDGVVNILDAQQVTRYAVGLPVPNTQRVVDFGDVTADGSIDIIDAQQIARFSIGLSAATNTGQPQAGVCGAGPPPPSTKFQIGARVSATATVDVHATPTLGSTLLDSKAAGESGTVLSGPVYSDNLWWWQIDYDNDPDGWSVEDDLDIAFPGAAAHWAFDDASGVVATDASGNGNDGTLVNGPTWVAGYLAGALDFDGIDDHVSVPNSPSLNPATELTIAAWVNATGGNAQNVIDKTTGLNTQYLIRLQNYKPRLLLSTTSGLLSLRSPNAISQATWHHVAVTYDGSTVNMYVDGVLENSTSYSGTMVDNGAGVTIGTSNTIKQKFQGSIDELRVYGTALTAAEIQILYNLTAGADTIPPSATVTSHADGTTVANQITLTADAADNIAVAGVQFYIDGQPVGAEVTSAPYSVVVDSNLYPTGSITLTAEARDGANLTALSAPVVVQVDNAAVRPSVVVIMTDDQRWDSMNQMPLTVGHFATEGVDFANSFVVGPICCPSRASFLTGQYVHNHGVLGNQSPYGAPSFDDSSTLPVWLHNAGYRTGIYGKYMNLYNLMSPYIPPGWDEWNVFDSPNGEFYNYSLNENVTSVSYGSSPADYSTDLLTNKAAQFIQSTPAGQPFFLFLSIYAPHEPFTPAPGDIGSLNGIAPWRPPSHNEADVSDKPTWVQNLPLATAQQLANFDGINQAELESLAAVDRAVDQIMSTLAAENRLGETMVVFTSDNGLSWGEHRWFVSKDCAYEECIRVPLFVRVPGATPRVENNLVQNTDLTVSIADWAGVVPTSPTNGDNLVDLISNPATPWRSEVLIEVLGRGPERNFQAVRSDQYLYAEYQNGDRELYDLAVDPYQLDNAYTNPAYAAVISALQSALANLKTK